MNGLSVISGASQAAREAVLAARLEALRARILSFEARYGRPAGAVRVLAASKTFPAADVRALAAAGQRVFGENYLTEARGKLSACADLDLEWHYIGVLQSRRAAAVARLFHWVQSVDRLSVAQRLSAARPAQAPPLKVCLEVNVSGEAGKAGVPPEAVAALADAVARLPRLELRGLMAIPAPAEDLAAQRRALRVLADLYAALGRRGHALDTLSMGMSADLEAAVAEGATLVRIGSALFGPRPVARAGQA